MFDALDGLAADMLAAGLAGQGRGAEDWRRLIRGGERGAVGCIVCPFLLLLRDAFP